MFRDWTFDLNFISWPWVYDNYIKFSPPFPSGKMIHPPCVINPFISPLSVLDKSTTWLCLIPLCRFLKSRIIIEAWQHANPLILGRRAGGGTHGVFCQPKLQVFVRWVWAGPQSHCQPKIQMSKCSPTAGAAPFHKKCRRSRGQRGLREHVPAHKQPEDWERWPPPGVQAPLCWALPHAGEIAGKTPDRQAPPPVSTWCVWRGDTNQAHAGAKAQRVGPDAGGPDASGPDARPLSVLLASVALRSECFSTLTAQRNHQEARRTFN